MMSYLKTTFIFLLSLFSSFLLAQRVVTVIPEGGGQGTIFNITQEIIYLDQNKREIGSKNIDHLAGNQIPVPRPEYARLRLTIELGSDSWAFYGKRLDLKLQIEKGGSLGNDVKLEDLKLMKKNGYKVSMDDLEFKSSDKGKLVLSFLMIDEKKMNTSVNPETFEYSIVRTAQFVELKKLPKTTLEDRQVILEGYAKLYDLFKFFQEDIQLRRSADYNGTNTVLNNAKNYVDSTYLSYNAENDYLSKAIHKFKIFGKPTLKNYELTRNYHQEVQEEIKNAEQQYYQSVSNSNNILELEKAQEDYLKLFKLAYFKYNYQDDFENKIKGVVQTWANSCESGGDKDACCTQWDQIQESKYFTNHQGDNLFVKAKSLCNPVDPCKKVASSYKRTTSIRTLGKLLADCQDSNCGSDICLKIKQKIEVVACQQKLENAKQESNIEERRALLSQIINDKSCEDIIQEALLLLSEVETLEIDLERGDTSIIKDEATGGNLLQYTIYFKSGNNIKLDSINGKGVQSFFEAEEVVIEWEEKDSILHIIVNNPEQEYELVFKSEATGDEETYKLTRENFVATIIQKGDLIIISLKNGSAPYRAKFVRENRSFSKKLDGPIDTLNKKELAQIEAGDFKLQVLDKYGKKGNETLESVQLSPGLRLSLWMYLVLPVLVMLGFIIYRNLIIADQ